MDYLQLLQLYSVLLLNYVFYNASAINYTISITTGAKYWDGTDNRVFISLKGSLGEISNYLLSKEEGILTSGSTNEFQIDIEDIGKICSVKLQLDGNDGWVVQTVTTWKTKENGHSTSKFSFYRELDDSTTRVATETIKFHGGWGNWVKWPPCTAKCNETQRVPRFRYCNRPLPGCGGVGCHGHYVQYRECKGPVCTTTTTPKITTLPFISTTYSQTGLTATDRLLRTTAVIDYKNPTKLIVLGIVLGLSLLLSGLLAVFLIVVLRDKKHDRLIQKSLQSNEPNENDKFPVYMNQEY